MHAIQMVVRNFYLILKLSLLPAVVYAVLFTIGSRKVVGVIGKQLSLREAWAATSGATGTILIMFLCIGVLQFGSQILLQSVLINHVGGALIVLRFAVEACFGVLWVSIVTTLYGHYVQGRPVQP